MKPLLSATLPPALREEVTSMLVTEAGFGGGPAMLARKVERFEPPVSVERALAWLEKHRLAMKIGHVCLADGRVLYFHPVGFLRAEPVRRRR
ncbi:MAG: hypothetical protein M3680_21450 [Myxococcota bacterium]|nr:hypothetical protein [Myxococcota bacterium]